MMAERVRGLRHRGPMSHGGGGVPGGEPQHLITEAGRQAPRQQRQRRDRRDPEEHGRRYLPVPPSGADAAPLHVPVDALAHQHGQRAVPVLEHRVQLRAVLAPGAGHDERPERGLQLVAGPGQQRVRVVAGDPEHARPPRRRSGPAAAAVRGFPARTARPRRARRAPARAGPPVPRRRRRRPLRRSRPAPPRWARAGCRPEAAGGTRSVPPRTARTAAAPGRAARPSGAPRSRTCPARRPRRRRARAASTGRSCTAVSRTCRTPRRAQRDRPPRWPRRPHGRACPYRSGLQIRTYPDRHTDEMPRAQQAASAAR